MRDFYCPRCMLVGVTHNECEPTGALTQNQNRFAKELYLSVQLKCARCAWVFWTPHPNAVMLAGSRGFTLPASIEAPR